MAQYSVEAFKWSGTGYNATYNTSHTAEIDDDDDSYEGSGDADETVSIDGGTFDATAGPPYVISIEFTDTAGDSHVEDFSFLNTGGDWYFVPGPGSEFSVGATLGGYQDHSVGWDYDDVVCFVGGTSIRTKNGEQPVETLEPGSVVATVDGSFKTLRLVLCQSVTAAAMAENPKLCPVKIGKGALGQGLPKRDLLVSRQHRMLVSTPVAARMFGTNSVLLSAIKLCALPGISVVSAPCAATYFHLVFDQHEVVFAEGAPSESLFPGAQALATVGTKIQAEIKAIFPNLDTLHSTAISQYMIPKPKQQARLLLRLAKNGKPCLETSGMLTPNTVNDCIFPANSSSVIP